MLFSYAVRSVYIESCSLFVRGGVYRVVKEAIGGMPAKAAVSALLPAGWWQVNARVVPWFRVIPGCSVDST
jgi:hypothetical protein